MGRRQTPEHAVGVFARLAARRRLGVCYRKMARAVRVAPPCWPQTLTLASSPLLLSRQVPILREWAERVLLAPLFISRGEALGGEAKDDRARRVAAHFVTATRALNRE